MALLSAPRAWAQTPMVCGVVPTGSNPAPRPDPGPGPSPAPCFEVQNVRVNIHFLQHDDGTGNFGEFNDGRPGAPGPTTGYDYAQSLVYEMNGNMDRNPVLNLAPGSALTPVPKRVRWVLDGVFFDRNSIYRGGACNPYGTPSAPCYDYESLCVRADSVINIFLVEEVEWPYAGPRGNNNTNAPVATPGIRGYVLDYLHQAQCDTRPAPAKLWAVVASPWTRYILANTQPWQLASAANHELGHILGLNHPNESDSYNWGECPDAPLHPDFPNIRQCWNLNEPPGPYCNVQSKVSNNLMDSNATQSSLAPCQIGIVQDNLNTCLKDRYVYRCSNCLPPTATFGVAVTPGCLPVPIWLDSRAAANYNWYKLEIDQVNAGGAPVTGTHYESTVYQQNLGRVRLDAVYAFAPSSTYRVKLTTHVYCGTAAVRVQTLTTPNCVRASDQSRSAVPAGAIPSTAFRH